MIMFRQKGRVPSRTGIEHLVTQERQGISVRIGFGEICDNADMHPSLCWGEDLFCRVAYPSHEPVVRIFTERLERHDVAILKVLDIGKKGRWFVSLMPQAMQCHDVGLRTSAYAHVAEAWAV